MQSMLKTKFEKNALDLEHRKLISEYNAILIAMFTFTLGIAGLVYNLIYDIWLSLFGFLFSYFVLNTLREDKSEELNLKIKEIRDL